MTVMTNIWKMKEQEGKEKKRKVLDKKGKESRCEKFPISIKRTERRYYKTKNIRNSPVIKHQLNYAPKLHFRHQHCA